MKNKPCIPITYEGMNAYSQMGSLKIIKMKMVKFGAYVWFSFSFEGLLGYFMKTKSIFAVFQ
jgi:hypothetical protein